MVIDAKYVDPKRQRSRVDLERYSACPYDVDIKYGGMTMRLDFGNTITLDKVRNYDPASPVNTGYFVFDGDAWQGTGDVLADAGTNIVVKATARYEVVSGTVHRQDVNSKVSDFCIAMAVIEPKGYATGGVCAKRKSDLLPMVELFKKEPITVR